MREGLDVAAEVFPGFKMDTVVIRGVNDDEMVDLLEFARTRGAELRFIEYMDVGGATHWTRTQVVPRAEMLDRSAAHYGPVTPIVETSSAPADRFRLADGLTFGIIASTTAPFCEDCDRSRLTADGLWYLCLYAARGIDLRGPLRGGAGAESMKELITGVWHARTDRGAEQRLGHARAIAADSGDRPQARPASGDATRGGRAGARRSDGPPRRLAVAALPRVGTFKSAAAEQRLSLPAPVQTLGFPSLRCAAAPTARERRPAFPYAPKARLLAAFRPASPPPAPASAAPPPC